MNREAVAGLLEVYEFDCAVAQLDAEAAGDKARASRWLARRQTYEHAAHLVRTLP